MVLDGLYLGIIGFTLSPCLCVEHVRSWRMTESLTLPQNDESVVGGLMKLCPFNKMMNPKLEDYGKFDPAAK